MDQSGRLHPKPSVPASARLSFRPIQTPQAWLGGQFSGAVAVSPVMSVTSARFSAAVWIEASTPPARLHSPLATRKLWGSEWKVKVWAPRLPETIESACCSRIGLRYVSYCEL